MAKEQIFWLKTQMGINKMMILCRQSSSKEETDLFHETNTEEWMRKLQSFLWISTKMDYFFFFFSCPYIEFCWRSNSDSLIWPILSWTFSFFICCGLFWVFVHVFTFYFSPYMRVNGTMTWSIFSIAYTFNIFYVKYQSYTFTIYKVTN